VTALGQQAPAALSPALLGTGAIWLAGAVVLFAGTAKLLDIPAFLDSLGSWTLVPKWSLGYLAVGVPTVEVLVAGLWVVARLRRPAIPVALLAMLVAMTGAYGAHVAWDKAPDCWCFGRIQLFEASQANAWQVVSRNAILCGMLMAGIFLRARGQHQDQRRLRDPRAPTGQSGFTLIETLIVIAMIAILISLVLPGLRGVREQTRRTVSLTNLRSHVQVFSVYATDFSDIWPYFTDPRATQTVLYDDRYQRVYPIEYFLAHAFWNIALAPGYYDGDSRSAVFYDPGHRPPASGTPYYYYSCTFFAAPAYWKPETRTGPQQWSPTKVHQVTFPSQKGLFLAPFARPDPDNPETADIWADPRGVGFCDGSSRLVPSRDFQAVYPTGDGLWPGCFHGSGVEVLHTIGGVSGRDVP